MRNDYEVYLNMLVDKIFAKGAKIWDWEYNTELKQWANEAKLHHMTIWKLGTRETKLPQLLTIYKLAKSVGMSLNLDTVKLKKRAA